MGGDNSGLRRRGQAGVYDFKHNVVPGSTDRDRDYWRDVGTIESFFEAWTMIGMPFNLYDRQVPSVGKQLAAGEVRA